MTTRRELTPRLAGFSLAILLWSGFAQAGITPSKSGTNLYDFVFDDAPLTEVVKEASRVCPANIISRSADLVSGSVTVNLKDVEWLPGFNSILDMHRLELIERMPGSGVFCVSARINQARMTDLLFHAPGSVPATNRISLKLADAPLKQLLLEIARQGKLNIRYPSDLADTGKFTIELEDVEAEVVLDQLLTICDLSVYKSPRLNAYVITDGFPTPTPASPVYTSSPSSSDSGVSDAVGFGIVVCIVSWFILLHLVRTVLRRNLAGVDSDTGWGRTKIKMFWGSLFVLCLVYSFTAVTCMVWAGKYPTFDDAGFGLLFVVGSAASCVSFGLLVLAVWLCRRYGWVPAGRRRTIAWCVALLPLMLILVDSPPIWHDYTWKDLPSPMKDAEKSGRCFRQLLETNAVNLHVSAPHLGSAEIETNSLAYSDEIEGIWKDIGEQREIVKKLNTFDGIDETIEMRRWDFDAETPVSFGGLRNVAQVYWAYGLLKSAQGDPAEGARQLAELHSVVRKALPYAKTLIRKMILVAVAGSNVETAHRIVASSRCTPEVLAILRDAFPPLTHEDMTLRWTFMTEYLGAKHLCKNTITNAKFIDAFSRMFHCEIGSDGKFKYPEPSGFWMRNVSRVTAFVFFKRNRTVRDLKEHYDFLIAGADKRPPDSKAAGAFCERYVRRPRLTNLGGWLLVALDTPSFCKAQEVATKDKVLSDLLALELNHRLGKDIELPDYYTGGKYLFDEKTGTFSSAGPDGKPGTQDDVTLGQWP